MTHTSSPLPLLNGGKGGLNFFVYETKGVEAGKNHKKGWVIQKRYLFYKGGWKSLS